MSKIQEQEHVPEPNTFPVYSKDFILRSNIVLDHANKSRRQMQDYIYAFNKRIETQMTYQKNLNQCAKLLEKYIDPNSEKCLSYISSAFKVDNQQRGNQARQLADSLKTQVIQPMTESLKKYTNTIKKAEKGFKKLNKDYSYFSQNYKKSKQDFNENDNQTKQMIITKNIYKYTTQFSQQKKNKLVTKTMESIRGKMQYQKNYKRSVSELNQLIQVFQRQATQMLNELEQCQRQQIKLESDGIRKLIVSEVSMFKNVEYDLINISKQMEKMYAQNDIQFFIKQAFGTPADEADVKDMSLKNVDYDKNLLTLSLKNVQEDYYPWALNIKKNKNLRKIMELRMKQLNNPQQIANNITDTNATVKVEQVKTQEISKEQQKVQKKIQQTKQVVDDQNNKQSPKKQENVDKPTQLKQDQLKKKQESEQTNNTKNTQSPQPKNDTVNQTSAQKEEKIQSSIKKLNQIQIQWQNLPKQFFNPPPNPNGVYQKFNSEQSYKDFLQLTQIINNVWGKGEKIQGEAKERYQALLQKNHFIRILTYLFIQQYRIEHKVLMNWPNYEKVINLVKILIDACDKFGDVFTLKGILALIFTFYSVKDQKTKKLLYQNNVLNDCGVWKRQDYWQASIFQSTYQQMANFNVQKGQTQSETLLRQKNIIFSQLASYCHYMLMLGITSKNVRRIVGRYCRLYQMTQDQNKDLSKMISNTTKQLKQTNSAVNTGATSTNTGTQLNSPTTPITPFTPTVGNPPTAS